VHQRPAPLIGKEITQEEYNWFRVEEQGYATYRDDVWPELEREYGLQRPEAKPVGVVYDRGVEHPITRLEEVWSQARGFIFVEKADEAGKLRELSEYGWVVVAGQGYPTRLIRQLLKRDDRVVLVLHDWDPDGLGIYRALGFHTRRTKHLGLALGERVVDLGLLEHHVKALNLPLQPSPPKYGGRPRCELSALSVLSVRMGVENPVLAYAVAAMVSRGLTLSPLEVPKRVIFEHKVYWSLMDAFREVVDGAVREAMKRVLALKEKRRGG
jgi:5S rRNA maturation endonuclease (ribonuclease M5)